MERTQEKRDCKKIEQIRDFSSTDPLQNENRVRI
jgi:hypothetical protein